MGVGGVVSTGNFPGMDYIWSMENKLNYILI